MINLYNEDCLEAMKRINDESIDLILCDLPYGTTACKWDCIIDFDLLWKQYKRIIKDRSAIVLFGSQPFTSNLIMSNQKWFRYEWIWKKNKGSNFQSVKHQPFKEHENICVFYKKKPTYNEQRIQRSESGKGRLKRKMNSERGINPITKLKTITKKQDPETRAPSSLLYFNCEMGLHPTQKPVKLLEYLIKTYTNETDLILDNCMGCGSTGIAAYNLNRRFIGIEKDKDIFETASKRLKEHQRQLRLF